MASPDLIWAIVRDNSSFLVKRNHAQFSLEPNNLTNKNTFKYSGLANKRTLGVSEVDGKIVLSIKKRGARRVKDSGHAVILGKHRRNKSVKAHNTIGQLTQRSFYRADLTKDAVARYNALHRARKQAQPVKPAAAAAAPVAAKDASKKKRKAKNKE